MALANHASYRRHDISKTISNTERMKPPLVLVVNGWTRTDYGSFRDIAMMRHAFLCENFAANANGDESLT